MDKAQAYNAFWNSFDMPAYDNASVPDGAQFPRISYEFATDNLEHTLLLSADLWYRESSWKNATQKVESIGRYIDNMSPIKCDNGYIYITRGNPFAQRMEDPDDNKIRRYYINVNVSFLTDY